jgi:hypothetical protein|tara:strand:+ start:344 stop:763 length:420 start_codon:yes stop_codon:yes gene_type:complete
MGKIKIQCEAIAKHSGVRCKAKGYFVPTSRRMLCRFHGCSKTIDSKTRKYKGLYRNKNIPIQNKIKLLKNLKNFKDKTEDEIERYVKDQEERSNSIRYRTKYYTRSYNQWRLKHRRSSKLTDQLDDFLQVFRAKSKVQS